MTSVAIMQPTYMPWLGYFSLMKSVDYFVYLDTVQFARRSWQQRNRIRSSEGEQILTIPVRKAGLRDQKIYDVCIMQGDDFPKKHINLITQNYKKAKFFDLYSTKLFDILSSETEYLVDITIPIIEWMAEVFLIKTTCMRCSQKLTVSGFKGELLLDICNQLRATQYISPPGSKIYLDESNVFKRSGVELYYAQYVHPVYDQLLDPFIPFMSGIDLIFNYGPDSPAILNSGFLQPIKN